MSWAAFRKHWREGYDWIPWMPHPGYPLRQRLLQASCHAFKLHTPSRDGSWVQGGFVCGRCHMSVFPDE